MTLPKPILKFRVHPVPNERKCFVVTVFKAHRDMYGWCKTHCHRAGMTYKTLACCHGYTKQRQRGKRWITLPEIGHMHFTIRSLTGGIITHESGHAALHWAFVKKLRFVGVDVHRGLVPPGEEDFCHALGEIARQIIVHTQHLWDRH